VREQIHLVEIPLLVAMYSSFQRKRIPATCRQQIKESQTKGKMQMGLKECIFFKLTRQYWREFSESGVRAFQCWPLFPGGALTQCNAYIPLGRSMVVGLSTHVLHQQTPNVAKTLVMPA
jgi:hypothetical protein